MAAFYHVACVSLVSYAFSSISVKFRVTNQQWNSLGHFTLSSLSICVKPKPIVSSKVKVMLLICLEIALLKVIHTL